MLISTLLRRKGSVRLKKILNSWIKYNIRGKARLFRALKIKRLGLASKRKKLMGWQNYLKRKNL
jgi:hypothetical protein